MSWLLFLLLVIFLVAALPTWPYSKGWGVYPSGGVGLVIVVMLVLVLTGTLRI